MPPMIEATGVTKRFGETTALDGLDLLHQRHQRSVGRPEADAGGHLACALICLKSLNRTKV